MPIPIRKEVAQVESVGAQCRRCPLKAQRDLGHGPVFGESHSEARFTIIGEAPSVAEVKHGRPFVGQAGMEAGKALEAAGWGRWDAWWLDAVACQPPGNDFAKMEAVMTKRNRERRRAGRELLLHPVDACRPVLKAQLEQAPPRYLTFGPLALQALIGGRHKVLNVRGGPLHVPQPLAGKKALAADTTRRESGALIGAPILPTLHPSFVLRSAKWREAFQIDVKRADRHFNNRLEWRDPRMVIKPSPTQLASFLGVEADGVGGWVANPTKARPFCFDYEAENARHYRRPDVFDPDEDVVRCIGIGNSQLVYVVPYKTCEHFEHRTSYSLGYRDTFAAAERFYHPQHEAEINAILRAWAIGPALKIGWNSGYYDSLLMRSHLGVFPESHLDAILLHRIVEGELPHSLAYVGSTRTDVHAWKAGKEATTGDNDEEYWLYNARDVVVTSICAMKLIKQCRAEGFAVFDTDEARGLVSKSVRRLV